MYLNYLVRMWILFCHLHFVEEFRLLHIKLKLFWQSYTFRYRMWIFLAYTWGSEGAKIFVNSDYQASSDANSMKSSIVGDYSNGMYFAPGNNNPEAIISDVAIYDRVLTDAEIRAIYSRTYQPLCLFDAVFCSICKIA